MKRNDKNKWFVSDTKESIFCTMESLTDLFTIIFGGNWERAKVTAKSFHEATEKEIKKYKLCQGV